MDIRTLNPKTDGFIGEMVELKDDEIAIRHIEDEKGKKLFDVVQVNPWQLWKVVPRKGDLPKRLDQMFTSMTLAEKQIQIHMNEVVAAKAKAEEEARIKAEAAKAHAKAMRELEAKNDEVVAEINKKSKKSK